MRSVYESVEVVAEAIRVLELESAAISKSAERLRSGSGAESIRRATALLNAALNAGGKIVVTGLGKSGKIAQKAVATFCSTGSFSVYLHPTEALHGDLGIVHPSDAVLALSYSGNTDELTRMLPSLKSLRVPIIGVGGNAESRLARDCDAWIDASVEQEACPHHLAPTTSTTLALALCDSLAVALMRLRGFDAQAFARNHPAGALGNRLSLRVAEVMHGKKELPCLGPEATMDEVVVASTRQKLGAVLITDPADERLLGIITDGDLRRALTHRERFFSMRAREVMTTNPVTASPTMLAYDALVLMEKRPSQISVLPVVDPSGKPVGVLRLHDLVQNL